MVKHLDSRSFREVSVELSASPPKCEIKNQTLTRACDSERHRPDPGVQKYYFSSLQLWIRSLGSIFRVIKHVSHDELPTGLLLIEYFNRKLLLASVLDPIEFSSKAQLNQNKNITKITAVHPPSVKISPYFF